MPPEEHDPGGRVVALGAAEPLDAVGAGGVVGHLPGERGAEVALLAREGRHPVALEGEK